MNPHELVSIAADLVDLATRITRSVRQAHAAKQVVTPADLLIAGRLHQISSDVLHLATSITTTSSVMVVSDTSTDTDKNPVT